MTAAPFDEQRILRARAAQLALRVDHDTADLALDVIPFGVGTQDYAVPAGGVREVRRLHAIARLPAAGPSLLGVARVRSTVVPVFDVPVLLDTAPSGGAELGWVIVLAGADVSPLALAAEWVDGVQALRLDDLTRLDGTAASGTLGVTPEGVIVLDVDALLRAPPVFLPAPDGLAASAGAPDADDPRQQGTS